MQSDSFSSPQAQLRNYLVDLKTWEPNPLISLGAVSSPY